MQKLCGVHAFLNLDFIVIVPADNVKISMRFSSLCWEILLFGFPECIAKIQKQTLAQHVKTLNVSAAAPNCIHLMSFGRAFHSNSVGS